MQIWLAKLDFQHAVFRTSVTLLHDAYKLFFCENAYIYYVFFKM